MIPRSIFTFAVKEMRSSLGTDGPILGFIRQQMVM